MSTYDYRSIERKWQRIWAERKTFRTAGPGEEGFDASRPKFYVLDMFPYPSGAGLHVGHPLGYIGTDIVARYKRMKGFNVLHPMGFDAFGLPAEQYAVETGVHPRVTTEKNIANMVRQLEGFGLGYDWDRRLATIEPSYYRWTQWIFLQIWNSWFDPQAQRARPVEHLRARLEAGELEVDADGRAVPAGQGGRPWSTLDEAARREVIDGHRLAYLAEVPVNWCPDLGTVLANEEVTADGRSERGNFPVYKRPLRQWQLRITAYAERLIADLDLVDWPEPVKQMQRNWVGRSEGARVDFPLAGASRRIEVFTTRPDTLFGATYMVLAPEHPWVPEITTDGQREAVEAYRRQAQARSDVDRQADSREKTGVFTGARAINPVTGETIPIWIADYVLMGYGTGAIMAVPAHDSRDFDFARGFGLPIRAVVEPDAQWLEAHAPAGAQGDRRQLYLDDPGAFTEAFTGQGRAIASSNAEVRLDGLSTAEAKARITHWLEQKGLGRREVQYKLRDWLFSRQRYWGEPFPVLHGEDGEIRAVDESELPVVLPEMEDFRPPVSDDPEKPPQPSLSRAPESWKKVVIDGKTYQRELNTMPQWAGSCWYYLRFIDPHNDQRLVDPDKERYWMGPGGVDLYVGGVEHAVLHLLYARFWHKVLYDLGHVSTPEPFGRLFNQGYILAWAYQDERGVYVPAEEVEQHEDGSYTWKGKPVTRHYGKMGKSLKNAVAPDAIYEEYGCDTLRLYEMYMGPLETSKPWITRDIVGISRFLHRVWRNFVGEEGALKVSERPAELELRRLLHRTIQRVSSDMEELGINTAIARLIELNNALVPLEDLPREVAEPFVLMLAPMAPHLAEELWERMGHSESVATAPWPEWDERYLAQDQVEIVVQVTGKVRGKVKVAAEADEAAVRQAAEADERIARHLAGKTVRKVIYIPGKLINIVAV